LIAACSAHGLCQAFIEQIAVRKPGKRIVVSEIVQLFLFFDVIERKRNIARELEQELHLLLIEKPDLRRVQG